MSRIAAIVLAAGASNRFRAADPSVSTKLVAPLEGRPLVRHAAEAACASQARPVVVVTGHARRAVEAALAPSPASSIIASEARRPSPAGGSAGLPRRFAPRNDGAKSGAPDLDLVFVHNADFSQGLSSSLRTGLSALPDDVEGVIVLLGDMPRVSADLIDRLIEAFSNAPGAEAVVPVHAGRRGNPALLARALFAPAAALRGDEGARRLLTGATVLEIEVADTAVTLDVDDPAALQRIDEDMSSLPSRRA